MNDSKASDQIIKKLQNDYNYLLTTVNTIIVFKFNINGKNIEQSILFKISRIFSIKNYEDRFLKIEYQIVDRLLYILKINFFIIK